MCVYYICIYILYTHYILYSMPLYIVYTMWYIIAAAPAVCDRRVSRLRHITHVVCVCVCLLVYVSVCLHI